MTAISILHLEDQKVCALKTRDDLASAKADANLSFEVTHVESLAKAIDVLNNQQFDAILADLSVPDSHGTKTVGALRKAHPTCPIVAFTAEDSTRHMLSCLREGADDYLVKGQAPSSAVVRALLNAIERRKTRSRLRSAQAKAAAIVNAVDDTIVTFDESGTIRSANPGVEKMFGYRPDEVVGENLAMLSPPQFAANTRQMQKLVSAQGADGEAIRWDSEGVHSSGLTFAINCTFCEITDGAANRTYCAIYRDTSEEKARMIEVEEARKRAEAATQAKSDFLASMSHELRTPLTAILGFAESLLLDHHSKDPNFVDSVRTILRNGEHLTGLINDILDLAKIEAGRMSVVAEPCSPYLLTTDVKKLLNVRAEKKSLSLTIDWPEQLPREIVIDRTRVRQVLINLVGNSIKFTESGKVTIALEFAEAAGAPPALIWRVTDTGVGMTEEACARIFEPFVQAEKNTSHKFGGTGLGLAITKSLVHMMGGEISVTSRPGEGSTFTVVFPLLDQDIDVTTMSALANADQSDSAADRAKKVNTADSLQGIKILLAEDGVDNQRLVSFILKKHGAAVDVVENGALAFDKATEAKAAGEPYNVVLMDMQMPVLDGYGATRKLRSHGYEGPIVALTAHAMKGDRDACLEAGCNEYATKPIDRDVLVRTVAEQAIPELTEPETLSIH